MLVIAGYQVIETNHSAQGKSKRRLLTRIRTVAAFFDGRWPCPKERNHWAESNYDVIVTGLDGEAADYVTSAHWRPGENLTVAVNPRPPVAISSLLPALGRITAAVSPCWISVVVTGQTSHPS